MEWNCRSSAGVYPVESFRTISVSQKVIDKKTTFFFGIKNRPCARQSGPSTCQKKKKKLIFQKKKKIKKQFDHEVVIIKQEKRTMTSAQLSFG